jgi:hypothetical protein
MEHFLNALASKFNMKWNCDGSKMAVMRIKIAVQLLLLLVTPATVGNAWEVTRSKDRMTDKTLTWARAVSGNATLLVGCLNGAVSPRLTWDRRIGYGTLGLSYRVDDGPVIPRMAGTSQDGRVLYPWLASGGAEVMRAKRLRVTVGDAFYDFDLVKGEALPKFGGWGC